MRNVPWVALILSAVPLFGAPHRIDQKTFDMLTQLAAMKYVAR